MTLKFFFFFIIFFYRVYALANKKAELEFEQRSMASLLSKFRIDYSDLQLIPDITKKPQESSTQFFNELIKDFLVLDKETSGLNTTTTTTTTTNTTQLQEDDGKSMLKKTKIIFVLFFYFFLFFFIFFYFFYFFYFFLLL